MGNWFENIAVEVNGDKKGWLMAPLPWHQTHQAGAGATLFITSELSRRELKYVIDKCFKLLKEKYGYEHQIHLTHTYALVDKEYNITKNLVASINAFKKLTRLVLTEWMRKDVDLKFTVDMYRARRG